jgi:hypothetical protein
MKRSSQSLAYDKTRDRRRRLKVRHTVPALKTTGAVIAVALVAVVEASESASADVVTACSVDQFCYCIQSDFRAAIDKEVTVIRKMIRDQKQHGKAIGYMSIPLSGTGGSYFPLNVKIATEVKESVEERFGTRAAWILNPIASDISLPQGASQADYMFMWTQVLEGEHGRGEDFDFVYFVGPSDIAKHFGLDGRGDMEKLEAYYDGLVKTDPALKQKVDKHAFRNYYTLRASVAFSLGAHDEWNVVRAINEVRRKQSGILGQLGVLFDGRGISPGLYETPIAPGNVAACPS